MDDSYIIAIDFGTAYSGYAFTLSSNPRVIFWKANDEKSTPKTPTSILFDEHGEFAKFGYEAKMAYTDMDRDEAQKQCLFDNFKMELHGKKIHKDMLIKAKNGKSMTAFKVITESLKYLKVHALQSISEHTAGKKFIASDFTWVLTLPAIWDAAAKQFMREAATEAGLVKESQSDKLVICLEPEAASIWSMALPSTGFIAEELNNDTLAQAPGTQYIVVDCGGGTIDITVHEVLPDETLKELHKASGNAMGGETVDKHFKSFLREIFSEQLWDEYEKENPSELQQMMYKFSLGKEKADAIYLDCLYNLGQLAGEDLERLCNNVQGASWKNGKILIDKDKMMSFFEDSLRGISESIENILKKDLRIEYILLVGGFASSKVLRSHIQEKFGGRCKVLCPVEPQQAILKGAVMFGQNPKVVTSRVSGLTYGIEVREKFDPSKHKPERKDGKWCTGLFSKLVTMDESVGCDEVREYSFTAAPESSKTVFKFFSTERKTEIEFVDEWGLEMIGSCVIPTPILPESETRMLRLEIKFGSTEMEATVTDIISKETARVTMNFFRG